jgi:hypothetical protein
MRKTAILKAVVVSALLISAVAWLQTTNASQNRSFASAVDDDHFDVHQVFGAFGGNASIGSFIAEAGDGVELRLSATSDDAYSREVQVQIAGSNHGLVFDATANTFNKTVTLGYVDNYTISLIKRAPFYTTLWVNGQINVHHEVPTNQTSIPTSSPASASPSPTTTIPELPAWLILPLGMTLALLACMIVRGRH